MKKRKIIIWCLLLTSHITLTGQYNVDDIPKHLLLNVDRIVRKNDTNIQLKSISKGIITVSKAITYLNNKSFEYPVIQYDEGEKVSKIKATLYNSKGQKIRDLKKDEILDHAYSGYNLISDNRYKILSFIYGKYPYTVEYSYQKTINKASLMFLQDFYIQEDYRQSIEKSNYSIICAEDVKILYKAQNTDIEPFIEKKKKSKVYTWTATNIQGIDQQDLMPSSNEIFPFISVQLEEFRFDEYIGNNTSWSSFGNFLTKLHVGRQNLTPKIKQEVKEIVSGKDSEIEKIKALYKYLQNNYRYVSVQLGIGGWQPMTANSVCTNKYGDCKALANYMCALLDEIDIVSNPIIIYSNDTDHGLDTSFVKPVFNHEILYIPEHDIWLDCTERDVPTNYIAYRNADRWALLLDGPQSRLIKTPKMDEYTNIRTSYSKILIENDVIKMDVKASLYGRNYELLNFLKGYEDDLSNNYVLKTLCPQSGVLIDFSIKKFEEVSKLELNATLHSTIKNRKKGRVLKVKPLYAKVSVPRKDNTRKYDVKISHAETVIDTFDYLLTSNLLIKDSSISKTLKSVFGEYHLRSEIIDNGLRIIRKFITHKYSGPAEEYNKYRTFVKKVNRFDRSKIYLEYSPVINHPKSL